MKRILFVAVLVVLLMAVGAVAAFAAPGSPVRGFGMMGQGYGIMGQASGGPSAMMGDDLEELLGIDHADIHAAHVSGKSLVEIAAVKGVSEDQLIETILAGRKVALQQAVEAGKLAQASADQMLKFMETNIKTMVEAKGMSGMMGQGLPGGMMGGTRVGPNGTSTGSCHGGQAPAQQGTEL
jgi:hypothetical protein